jgi:hypothetical protein
MNHAHSFALKSSVWLFIAAGVAVSVAAGCAGADEPPATGGTGGTGATGGTTGGMPGSGGMGAGGMGVAGVAPITSGPLPEVGCDYTTVITKSCAIAGCHRAVEKAGGLNMAVEPALRNRLVDVTSTHSQIDCDPGVGYMECVPPPAACPAGAKLVDRAVPANSWVLKKLDGGASCGDAMPLAPGDDPATGWGPDAKTCLQTFFNALAANK